MIRCLAAILLACTLASPGAAHAQTPPEEVEAPSSPPPRPQPPSDEPAPPPETVIEQVPMEAPAIEEEPAEEPVFEEPAAEQPPPGEPVNEEAAVEESVAREPLAEEPALEDDHSRAREGVSTGELMPLEQILGGIATQFTGHHIGVDGPLPIGGGRYGYAVKWLTEDGAVLYIYVDAETGAIISVKGL